MFHLALFYKTCDTDVGINTSPYEHLTSPYNSGI
jgi:hypothetical protein